MRTDGEGTVWRWRKSAPQPAGVFRSAPPQPSGYAPDGSAGLLQAPQAHEAVRTGDAERGQRLLVADLLGFRTRDLEHPLGLREALRPGSHGGEGAEHEVAPPTALRTSVRAVLDHPDLLLERAHSGAVARSEGGEPPSRLHPAPKLFADPGRQVPGPNREIEGAQRTVGRPAGDGPIEQGLDRQLGVAFVASRGGLSEAGLRLGVGAHCEVRPTDEAKGARLEGVRRAGSLHGLATHLVGEGVEALDLRLLPVGQPRPAGLVEGARRSVLRVRALVLDERAFGYPVRSLAEVKPGTYHVQAVLHRYETFHRADGHTVKMPMDRGEGSNWVRRPGNLYSKPVKMHLDAASTGVVAISMDQENPPIEKPQDPASSYAVTGLYFYDESVWEVLPSLEPSGRGELEITDVNNWYVDQGLMELEVIEGFWGDAGESIDAYYEVNDFVRGRRR